MTKGFGRDPALVASPSSPASRSRPTGFDPAQSFTPGPWRIFDDGDERFEIAVGQMGENRICEPLGDTPEQAAANGYLIAAAPQLYEAGRFLLDIADALLIDRGAPADAAREKMRAALAVAESDGSEVAA